MELPTVKPAELKYSRDVSLDNVMKWYTNYRAVDLTGRIRQSVTCRCTQKERCRFGLVYFLCGNSRPVSKSRLCCDSLQDFAMQEKELPLNILCGSRLCCQWELCSCICRTGKRIAAEQQLKFHYWAGLFSQWWTFPNWSSDTATRLNLSLGMNCNRLFLNLMLLGKRLIMTGALEVFQCHHHGRMTGDDRETRKRHIFPISASALNCIIVQFDRRYQMNQWPELKLKMKLWM